MDVTDIVAIQDEGVSSLQTPSWASPDLDNVNFSVASTPANSNYNSPTACASTVGNSRVTTDARSRTPSSTQKSRATTKHTIQDMFTEGSAKENEILDHLWTQRHEQALGEQELKCRKLDHKALEKQHQREQHEYRMLQIWVMAQNSQAAPMAMQPQDQPSLRDTWLS
jgi:hypothetical protein